MDMVKDFDLKQTKTYILYDVSVTRANRVKGFLMDLPFLEFPLAKS